MDEHGDPLNEKYAERRAGDLVQRCCPAVAARISLARPTFVRRDRSGSAADGVADRGLLRGHWSRCHRLHGPANRR
ncbi:hypothetical protein [Micromonospora sp. DT63]|uniref:hypothetical protein n=1 Tax=Micromonospora sp. DT63 TaxID=3393441 RepID=UPI003CF7DD00